MHDNGANTIWGAAAECGDGSMLTSKLCKLVEEAPGYPEDYDILDRVEALEGGAKPEKVLWLNEKSGHKQPALGFLTYGNEPGYQMVYSAVVITLDIPPWAERNGGD
ncbi:hypothetical protein LTR66_015722 [Elasticomyces elasticus]|nr:hypothetical protein LTR66_015722 [Elasticomyces elasticus]